MASFSNCGMRSSGRRLPLTRPSIRSWPGLKARMSKLSGACGNWVDGQWNPDWETFSKSKMMTRDVFSLDAEKDRVIEERKKTEKEVLAKVPEGQRDAFKVLMGGAQKSGYWSEDHTYFCDLYIGAIGRWIVTEYGRRFAEAGCIDHAEDIHFLPPNEIRKAP